MKVTFIDHSGFLVELEHTVVLFDYYKGEIPHVPGKKWYIFSSHFHEDHFQEKIFHLREVYDDVTYILSKDIKQHRKHQLEEPYELVSWNETYQIGGLKLHTLQSTDEGCAFYVEVEGKYIYHAGDLNWWHWIGEPEADNEYMKKAYIEQMEYLKDKPIDLAFVLLDPRQEEAYDWGMNYFMEHTKAKLVMPMHMWGQFSWCEKYLQSEKGKKYAKRFCPVHETGEVFSHRI